MFNKIKQIVPKYAVIPLMFTVLGNMLAYYGSTALVSIFNIPRHSVAVGVDSYIPLIPWWSVIYFGCYFSWIAFYIIACRDSKKTCYDFVCAEFLAKMLCLVIFVLYPTVMAERGEVVKSLGDSFFDNLCALIYKFDKPYNLFPSVHCLASYIGFRGVCWNKRCPIWLKIFAGVFAILVFLSTLFTRQHYVVDIFGGILVAEIGIFISKRLKLGENIRRKVCHEQKDK